MKKLLVLLFSTLISVNSYGEWFKVTEGVNSGNTHYIETDSINEHNGYVYWWDLLNLIKPSDSGNMSWKVYNQGDCGVKRVKYVSYIFYKQQMGKGSGITNNPENSKWEYPSPGSTLQIKLDFVCDYID